jgi:dTDP-4-dehydrorhamnose reductase
MKILVTGSNGLLGQHLCRLLKREHEVIATGRGEKRLPFADVQYVAADVAGSGIIPLVKELAPEVIIHTAAMSKPDECNDNRTLCDQVNIGGTEMILEGAKAVHQSPQVIYISSDFVLGDGGPHDEAVTPSPLNYYGESKLKAEQAVEASGLHYTIVRPVFMYGETWEGMRSTFLHWVKQSLETGRRIKVVSDQQRTPTYVGDICNGIASIIHRKATGIYHLGGEERMSPYDMAVRAAEHLQLDASLLEAVTGDTFKEPVTRAKEGGVLINKAKTELGFRPVTFAEGLRLVFR